MKSSEEETRNEIEVLKNLLNHYSFEQNHILNDYLPRIIFLATMNVTISLTLLHFDYFLFGFLVFFIGIFEMARRSLVLMKDRECIQHKRMRINAAILERYGQLGVDIGKLSKI